MNSIQLSPIFFFNSFLVLLAVSCSSKPILPDVKSVEVSRESAGEKCKELGIVYGKTLNSTGKVEEQALSNLKENAAKKGANYVFLQEYGAIGTSVKGIAYDCP